MPNPVKSLGYIKCYNSSSPRPIKALAILSDKTVTRPTVDPEDLNPLLQIRKKGLIFLDHQ